MLKKYRLEGCKKISTLMATSAKLDVDEAGKAIDQKTYRDMIGSLLYLTISRPDIQFSVYLCVRFQANLKESHLIVVKRIFKYFSEMINIGLWYLRDCEFTLHVFSDADYVGCKLDRKSTSGTYEILVRCIISWSSRKQGTITLSTAEVEHVAAESCYSQVL